MIKHTVIPIVSGAVWISLNEFVRNEVVLKSYWVNHYAGLGFTFPSDPINGALWGLWSLVMAVVFFLLAQKFSYRDTFLTGWVAGYVAMWLVIGNLGVLPLAILPVAVPWSIAEALGAAYLVRLGVQGKK